MAKIALDRWMTELPDEQRRLPLCQVAIPGSHNSFTYSLDPASDVGPDEADWMRRVGRICGCVAKTVIYRWSVCQEVSCSEQLNLGVRYFDFRIAEYHRWTLAKRVQRKCCTSAQVRPKSVQEPARILHALFGCQVDGVLGEIRQFLHEHPEEVVILDFQHIYAMTTGDKMFLKSTLVDIFGTLICPPVTDVPSLSSLRRDGRQVILVSAELARLDLDPEAPGADEGGAGDQSKWGKQTSRPLFWPRSLCPNPWPNTASLTYLDAFLRTGLQGRDTGRFFVSQGILTAQMSTVFRHLFSTLKEALVTKTNRYLVEKWIPSVKREEQIQVNIVMADFVEMDNFTEKIVELNYS